MVSVAPTGVLDVVAKEISALGTTFKHHLRLLLLPNHEQTTDPLLLVSVTIPAAPTMQKRENVPIVVHARRTIDKHVPSSFNAIPALKVKTVTTLTNYDHRLALVHGDSLHLTANEILLLHHAASLLDVTAHLNKETLQDGVTLPEEILPPVAVIGLRSMDLLHRAPEPRVERVVPLQDLDHLVTVLTALENIASLSPF